MVCLNGPSRGVNRFTIAFPPAKNAVPIGSQPNGGQTGSFRRRQFRIYDYTATLRLSCRVLKTPAFQRLKTSVFTKQASFRRPNSKRVRPPGRLSFPAGDFNTW